MQRALWLLLLILSYELSSLLVGLAMSTVQLVARLKVAELSDIILAPGVVLAVTLHRTGRENKPNCILSTSRLRRNRIIGRRRRHQNHVTVSATDHQALRLAKIHPRESQAIIVDVANHILTHAAPSLAERVALPRQNKDAAAACLPAPRQQTASTFTGIKFNRQPSKLGWTQTLKLPKILEISFARSSRNLIVAARSLENPW